tara:strand:+ start:384 stop:1652 length:1269 start_codon:yes stop_codon:yes gene_type:complete
MKVLVIGGGGREHALCWTIAASPLVEKLWCAPGNAGISEEAECVNIAVDNIYQLIEFVKEQNIDLVVVGPEKPLVQGISNRLEKIGVRSFGPSAEAAMLEGSKSFMKNFCSKYNIPTAEYQTFEDPDTAKAFISQRGVPIVIKADGLAAGKGVIICNTLEQANSTVDQILTKKIFGNAGNKIVVEEYLQGIEASFFTLVDGKNTLPLASAQDHKRVGDGDIGPNTGGMGAYSPAPAVSNKITTQVMETIITPTVEGMRSEGKPYKGVLYAGLMLTDNGPKLIEFNVRFGDPECQVLMPRLRSDIVPALIAACDGELRDFDLQWYEKTALTVVLATKGYPGPYINGSVIYGIENASKFPNAHVFHSGTKIDSNMRITAAGGRVLSITAVETSLKEAQRTAYELTKQIEWPEGFYRRDIGWRAL